MTKTLEQAIEKLRQMSAEQQDSIAKLLLHEIDEDERWRRSTALHEEKLRGLVEDVLQSDQRGDCDVLDPDKL